MYLAVYIEKEIAENFNIDLILDDFRSLKRSLQFWKKMFNFYVIVYFATLPIS